MDARTEKMEDALFQALERTDAEMERRYGDRFRLHPARLPDGKAASRQYDGLFSLSAGFSAGFGSQYGPGYALDLRMVTLDAVPDDFRAQFEREAIELLQQELDREMPERHLKIVRDTNGWKIIGDLHIGKA
jgi:hypothetical protein